MPTTTSADGARLNTLTGTGKLLRFGARRSRAYLIWWIVGLVGVHYMIAAAFPELYPESADRAELAASSNTPAMRSMTGPVEYLDAYTGSTASVFAHQMILWTGAIVAVMFILLVTRLTRADEETSRLEVIRSNPVGRRADLAAALLLTLLAAIALGALMTLSVIGLDGFDAESALLYGFSYTALGFTFAAVTAVASQLAGFASSANGIGFGALGVAVLAAAVGNAQENGATWLSPIGWVQLTFVTTPEQRWWPLTVAVAVALTLVALAFTLVARRDFGQGMIAGRSGRAEARPGLRSAWALTLRLTRGLQWSAVVTMLLVGAAYGSVLGSVDEMLDGMSDVEQQIIAQSQGSLEENFAVTVTLMGAFIATIFGLLVIGRARTEETGGRGELLAAAPTTRAAWPGTYLPTAIAVTAVGVAAGGLALAVTGALSIDQDGLFWRLFAGALVHLPAVWVLTALAFALHAWLPRLGWLRWLPWMYVFMVGIFGDLLDMPQMMRNISPYEHTPGFPAQSMDWPPLAVLTAVAVVFTLLGYRGLRRRDLQFS